MATRKIYIDSRQAECRGSDFTLTLTQSVQVSENTVAYIDDIILPNQFRTADAHRCFVYVSETYGGATLSFRTRIPTAIILALISPRHCKQLSNNILHVQAVVIRLPSTSTPGSSRSRTTALATGYLLLDRNF